jgi:Bacterial Ig-like domain (group 2)
MQRVLRLVTLLASLTTFVACSDAAAGPFGTTVTKVTILGAPASLAVGATVQLSALASDAQGQARTRVFAWNSSKPQVATVTKDGLVTGIASGSTVISASVDGQVDSVSISIIPQPASPVRAQLPNNRVVPFHVFVDCDSESARLRRLIVTAIAVATTTVAHARAAEERD